MTETLRAPAPTTRTRRTIAVAAAGTLLAGMLVSGGVVAGRASVDDVLPTASSAVSTSARDPGTTVPPDAGSPDDGGGAEGSAFGSIAGLDGAEFVLVGPGGGTLSVRTTDATVVDPALGDSVNDLSEGLTVFVTGTQAADGTVTASRITATPDLGSGGTGGTGGTGTTEPSEPGEAV